MGIFDKFKSLFKKKDEKKDDSLLEEELKEKISKDSLSAEIKNIYDQMRSKLISVLRKKVL